LQRVALQQLDARARALFLRLYFKKLAALRTPALTKSLMMTILAGERQSPNSEFYIEWVKPLGFGFNVSIR
jgi:hypothetical protein